jgi:DNA-binding response OmpR family regulator
MVVDDEPDITFVMKQALVRDGFEVDGFTNPKEALDKFTAGKYDMVITDIRMPQMNGFELYRELIKKDSKIKVAFMTAFDVYENEFKKVLPSIDVKYFFKKPMRMNELVERIKQETC